MVDEYGLNDYESNAGESLNNMGCYNYERCRSCSYELVWGGYGGGSPVTNSLVSLLENTHFMASTVILSAVLETSIGDLTWAVLVDSGIDWERANKVADGRMNRIDCINLIVSLTDLEIKDISFPYRNLVAYGKGFVVKEDEYREE